MRGRGTAGDKSREVAGGPAGPHSCGGVSGALLEGLECKSSEQGITDSCCGVGTRLGQRSGCRASSLHKR